MRLHRLTGLEQDKIIEEYKELLETIQDLSDILTRPERLTEVVRAELIEIRDDLRRCAPHRDQSRSPGSDHRGSDRAAGRGGHAVARRLCQVPAGDRLSGAAARRPRQGGHRGEGRGLHREALRGPHPRHAAVLLQSRQGLLAEGLRAAAGRARLARQADREPAAAGGGREDQRGAAGQAVRRAAFRVHGDQPAAPSRRRRSRRSRGRAPSGIIARRPARRRPPGRRGAHRRTARDHAGAPAAARRSASTRRRCGPWAARPPACAASGSATARS